MIDGVATAPSANAAVLSLINSPSIVTPDVELLTTGAIPAYSSIEVLTGSKLILQTTDYWRVYGSGAVDVTLSIMEIT